jgi:hypothetical protein
MPIKMKMKVLNKIYIVNLIKISYYNLHNNTSILFDKCVHGDIHTQQVPLALKKSYGIFQFQARNTLYSNVHDLISIII